MPKLTKRIADALEPRSSEYFVWDSEIPRFGLRVLPRGREGYVVQYRAGRRSGGSAPRAQHGPDLRAGATAPSPSSPPHAMAISPPPSGTRGASRSRVEELAERFDKEHIAIRVKASTAKQCRRNLERFILPAFGQLTVTGIARADVARFHYDLRHISY